MKNIFMLTIVFSLGFSNLWSLTSESPSTKAFGGLETENLTRETLQLNPKLESPANLMDVSARQLVEIQANPIVDINKEWQYIEFGSHLGLNGLFLADLNNDSVEEIVVTAHIPENNPAGYVWHILNFNGDGEYEIAWTSDFYTSPINEILPYDLNADGILEIIVGLDNHTVQIYRGSDLEEIASFYTAVVAENLVVGDTTADGNPEIVISDGNQIAAYDGITYQQIWLTHTPGYGGKLIIANVDLDSEPEIISSRGFVLHGPTQAVEWTYSADYGFGMQIVADDVDGDGIDEIVGISGWKMITVFDADNKTPAWEIPTSWYIEAIYLADVNNDTFPDIVYGNDQGGKIHAVDAVTHEEIWSIDNPEHGVTRIIVGDPDRDSALEVLWGAGYSSSGPDFLYIADITTGLIEWNNLDIDGPFAAVDVGDVDDDGDIEILAASDSTNSGYSDGAIFCFSAETHEIEWKILDVPGIMVWSGINSIRIGDVDQDGETEFVIATADLSNGLIQIYDGRTHTLERQSNTIYGEIATAMELGDIDKDGQTEIVVGSYLGHTGASGVHIFVYDGSTAALEWQSFELDYMIYGVNDIHLVDIDNDSRMEIIAAMYGPWLYVFDAVTHVVDAKIPSLATSITNNDLDGDGTQSIIAGRSDGKIDVIDGKSFAIEDSKTFSTSTIGCLVQADIRQDPAKEWFVCSGNKLYIYSLHSGEVLWQSKDLGRNIKNFNQFLVGQIDSDIDQEVVFGTTHAVYQYEGEWIGALGFSSMTVSSSHVNPYDQLTYTIKLKNLTQIPMEDVQFINQVPAGITYEPGSLYFSNGTGSYNAGSIVWNGDLPPQSQITITYVAGAEFYPTRTVITNSGQLKWSSNTQQLRVNTVLSPHQVYLPLCLKFPPGCGNYFDNFQNPSSGWLVYNDDYLLTEYFYGEYRVFVKQMGDGYLIKAPTCKRENYIIEADARWGVNKGDHHGLVFGMADDFSSYYTFIISPEYQAFALAYYQNGIGTTWIVPGTYSSSIDSAGNHLKVTRNNAQITLAINGSILGTWTHSGTSGPTNVGVLAASLVNVANADARFDNFSVTAIPGSTAAQLMGNGNLDSSNPQWASLGSMPFEIRMGGNLTDE